MKRGTKPIVDRAKQLAPKDQHDLEKSIKAGDPVKAYRNRTPESVSTFIGIDESQDRRLHIYAEAQETGLRDMKAQPYMRPALDEKTEEALDQIGKELWIGIEKRARLLAKRGLR